MRPSNGWHRVIKKARRSWPRRYFSATMAATHPAEPHSCWRESPFSRETWKRRALILSKLSGRRTIPARWRGAIFIWAGFLTSRRSARPPWRNITRPWPRATLRRTPRLPRKKVWPRLTSRAVRVKLEDVMKRLLLISLVTLAFSTAPMPAAQRQPSAGSAPPSQAVGKRPPQAKTHPEFNDYNTAYAITGGAQMEKAADEFATKYPASELRSYLYAKAMHEYQSENNSGKMLAMRENVLALDAYNLAPLATTARVLADNLTYGDQ